MSWKARRFAALVLAVWPSIGARLVAAAPIVTVTPPTIETAGITTLTISLDPNGFNIQGFVVGFQVDPEGVATLSFTDDAGSHAGNPGGPQFGWSSIDMLSVPSIVGTVTLRGVNPGATVSLVFQAYSDGVEEINDTSETVVATVVLSPPSETPTQLPTSSSTLTPTLTQEPTVTPTPTTCAGSCNGDDIVTLSEVIDLIAIALSALPTATCAAGDVDSDDSITIEEIVAALQHAADGCP